MNTMFSSLQESFFPVRLVWQLEENPAQKVEPTQTPEELGLVENPETGLMDKREEVVARTQDAKRDLQNDVARQLLEKSSAKLKPEFDAVSRFASELDVAIGDNDKARVDKLRGTILEKMRDLVRMSKDKSDVAEQTQAISKFEQAIAGGQDVPFPHLFQAFNSLFLKGYGSIIEQTLEKSYPVDDDLVIRYLYADLFNLLLKAMKFKPSPKKPAAEGPSD